MPLSEHEQRLLEEMERNLYKNATGNRLVFEEVNRELGLAFRYNWSACDQ